MKVDQWLYFGCHREAGHYVFKEGMSHCGDYQLTKLSRFDGALPSQDNTAPYIATVTRLEGWGFTALAFWDYSVDKRGGSNSVIFAPSLTIEPLELLDEARVRFYTVFERLPVPVQLLSPPTNIEPS
jgi:hypothetical protein